MTQQNIKTEVPSDASPTPEQGAGQELQTVPTPAEKALQSAIQPRFPSWPTSKPGPRATLPPPGMRPTHLFRSEQMTEIGYDQETGEPGDASIERSLPDESQTGSVSFDLKPKTAQETLGKRKQRL